MDAADIRRFRANWQDEVDNAFHYRAMAAHESNPRLAQIYERLAGMEDAHAAFWEERLRQAGQPVGQRRPSWRSRLLGRMARWWGARAILPTIAAAETADRNRYGVQAESRGTGMMAEERSHAHVLERILAGSPDGISGAAISRLEGRHRASAGNALRAAVLGANDGLCSNLSLLMGITGTGATHHTLVLAGLAGLLAGACSMALGEWMSVRSASELAEREIAVERDELEQRPQEEIDELRLIYEAKGLEEGQARRLAEQLLQNRGTALDTLAREELGIDPGDLKGSPLQAAGWSFLLFASGAIVPLLPYLLAHERLALPLSLAVSAAGLFAIGGAITLFTGRSVLRTGIRQVLLGGLAAGITYGAGHLVAWGMRP